MSLADDERAIDAALIYAPPGASAAASAALSRILGRFPNAVAPPQYVPSVWAHTWAQGRLRKVHRRTLNLLKQEHPKAAEWELELAATRMISDIMAVPHWNREVPGQ